MTLYDAHIHLSDDIYADHIQHILTAMRQTDMAACCVSTNSADSMQSLSLAATSTLIIPFVGIHPEFAASADLDVIENLICNESVRGIGEIGLDPTYDVCMDQQRVVFEHQLDLAERLDLPVSVHSRKSLGDILDMLGSYKCRTLLHWFDGSKSSLRRAMDMGLYVSYGPLSVYATDRHRIISLTHTDRILVETDGPVRFSHCFSSLPTQPIFLPSVVLAVADAMSSSYDDTLMMLESNTLSYLDL